VWEQDPVSPPPPPPPPPPHLGECLSDSFFQTFFFFFFPPFSSPLVRPLRRLTSSQSSRDALGFTSPSLFWFFFAERPRMSLGLPGATLAPEFAGLALSCSAFQIYSGFPVFLTSASSIPRRLFSKLTTSTSSSLPPCRNTNGEVHPHFSSLARQFHRLFAQFMTDDFPPIFILLRVIVLLPYIKSIIPLFLSSRLLFAIFPLLFLSEILLRFRPSSGHLTFAFFRYEMSSSNGPVLPSSLYGSLASFSPLQGLYLVS